MARVCYDLNKFLGMTFIPVWGEGIPEIEVQLNPKTNNAEFKIGPTYLPNFNQLGWYLKGKLDNSKVDSRFRPGMLIEKTTNKSAYELYKELKVEKVTSSTTPKKETSLNPKPHIKFEVKSNMSQKELIKYNLVMAMHKVNRPISKDELYTPLAKNYHLSFDERKRLVYELIKDKIIKVTEFGSYVLC